MILILFLLEYSFWTLNVASCESLRDKMTDTWPLLMLTASGYLL